MEYRRAKRSLDIINACYLVTRKDPEAFLYLLEGVQEQARRVRKLMLKRLSVYVVTAVIAGTVAYGIYANVNMGG